MAGHQFAQPSDGEAIELQYAALMHLGFGSEAFGFVRKIDDEAGISP